MYAAGLNLDILLWVGCSGAFHHRYQQVSRAMVSILEAAGVRFGILGKDESCCGDPARRLGEEDLFLALARRNIRHLKRHHIKKIVTLCPHCFNTLKNEYPRIEEEAPSGPRASIEVVHATEYVKNLIEAKRISPRYPIRKSVAFHDPCYLGRANGIYDEPRILLESIPGVELVEMSHTRSNSLCCGGGGGGMWLDGFRWEKAEARISEWRVREAVNVLGAELSENGDKGRVLAVACPYEPSRFGDAAKTVPGAEGMEVKDIAELLAEAMGV